MLSSWANHLGALPLYTRHFAIIFPMSEFIFISSEVTWQMWEVRFAELIVTFDLPFLVRVHDMFWLDKNSVLLNVGQSWLFI